MKEKNMYRTFFFYCWPSADHLHCVREFCVHFDWKHILWLRFSPSFSIFLNVEIFLYQAICHLLGQWIQSDLFLFLVNHRTWFLILQRFLRSMDMAYAAADLVVSRAGAMTCSELLVTGKPAILVTLQSFKIFWAIECCDHVTLLVHTLLYCLEKTNFCNCS